MSGLGEGVKYVSHVYEDWVTCRFLDGQTVAYNKITGKWCQLPDPACPIVPVDFDWIYAWPPK